jgi:Beta-glucosidase/6-phospho-beta-glucosidase/beta-galactosidase
MIGYILWSFTDNFEWFLGWKPHFGAFSLSRDLTLSEHYKPGVQPFVDTIKAWKDFLPDTTL